MPAELKHHASGRLSLVAALAAAAGFVDAFVFQNVTPVFVANMSGNLVRLGMSAGVRDGRQAAAALVALVGFSAGVIAGAARLDTHVRSERLLDSSALLFVETGLLTLLAFILRIANITYSPTTKAADYPVILIGAAAMGLQAIALRRVGEVAVSTTYGTGAVVRVSEKTALAFRKTPRPDEHRRRTSIVVLSVVLMAYVGGAFAAASTSANPMLLLIPAAVSLVGAIERRRHHATSVK
ncbi:MAG: DUF1275 domain-containing protein [Actinomycetia bacterium]|nr:DUF1275 domain-containing protein [Actinomycetes bacterium]